MVDKEALAMSIAVDAEEKTVHLVFTFPIQRIGFSPVEACEVAVAIIKAAVAVDPNTIARMADELGVAPPAPPH